MPNAIIGFYSGYTSLDTDKGGLRIFVESFRKYNTSDLIIITLVLPIQCPELIEFAKKNYCVIEPVYLDDVKTGNRWSCYKNVLTKMIYKDLQKILIMDMNDAMFTADPFSIETDNKLYCACEKTIYDIECYDNNLNSLNINTTWMNQCHLLKLNKYISVLPEPINNNNLTRNSAKNLIESKIYKNPIICSGTILGNYNAIMKLIDWGCNFMGADQGLLNIYVYFIAPAECLAIPLFDSEILTMDSINFDTELNKDENGYILNNDGKKFAICHQIDRGNHLDHFMKL
jgi:hypothetical protein